MRNKIRTSKELQNYLINHNIGILDETSSQMLAQTGGTGAHWHIGPDKRAIEGLRVLISKKGAKILQLGGQIQYSPYLADFKDNASNKTDFSVITKEERVPGSYVRQYDLSDKPKVKTTDYTVPPQQQVKQEKERTIADLAKFTGGFETFRPYAYQLETSDGKMQTLAGYGSAKDDMIKLARNGQLTEEIAREEMENHLQNDYDS